MNDAPCSWRVSTYRMEDREMASTSVIFSSPGMPKTWVTPSFSRQSTIRAAVLREDSVTSQIKLQRLSRGGRGRALRVVDVGEAEGPGPRDESEADRLDRNLGGRRQGLPVAGLGVPVPCRFLRPPPCTTRLAQAPP